MLAASPAIWTAHFLLSYSTAAIWCGWSRDAMARCGLSGWQSQRIRCRIDRDRDHRLVWLSQAQTRERDCPHDADTPEDRHRFLGFATLLLSGLSAVATIYVGARGRVHPELPLMRRCWLCSDIVTLAAVWFGPLPQLAHRAFFAHMILHMGVVAIAAPLLAVGIAGATLDPVRKIPCCSPQYQRRWSN